MNVDKETWAQATQNLIERRERGTVGTSASAERIRDYAKHLSKVSLGRTLLDVGCGAMHLKDCVPEGVLYSGMDAFPVSDKVALPHAIEISPLPDKSFDTVCAFAVLDNCQDFDKAVEQMKRIASKNVVILTGVDIEIDKYHTFKLSLKDFDERFNDWTQGYREQLDAKVWLLEYIKR